MDIFEWLKLVLGICGILLAVLAIYFLTEIALIVRSVRRIIGRMDMILDVKAWYELFRTFVRRKD